MKTLFYISSVIFLLLLTLLRVDGIQAVADPVQITTTGGSHPTVSPDGAWVAYKLSGGGLAKIATNGGQLDTLTTFGREPDWSRTNDLIVFRQGLSLYTVSASTGDTTFVRSGGFDDNPSWSPNGDEIAVEGSIIIVSYPDGAISEVPCFDPGGGACAGESPTWSTTGTEIAFEDGLEILKVARSGGVADTVVADLRDVAYPAWSPDGEWIAFTMDGELYDDAHIWAADARGIDYGLVQVTSGPFLDLRPAWSPGSDTIYFESDRSGQDEIWKIPFLPNAVEEPFRIGIGVPETYALCQNHPNPFNSSTEIRYKIPQASLVRLTIFSTLGQEIRTLVEDRQSAGEYAIIWDGRNDMVQNVASGIYFCQIRVGEFSETVKMVLLR